MLLILFLLSRLISLYALVMLIYCLCTWFIRDPNNRFMMFLAKIAEPPLKPIRRLLWRAEYFRNSPVDFSSLILFFILRAIIEGLGYLARFVR